MRSSWLKRGASPAELGWVDDVLDPDVLTIGFARRVPTYKRLTLMLRDPERLKALLLDPERPVQLVIAGKSHPADDQGKRLIQQLVQFADDPEVRHRIVFLPNYDIAMAQILYPGCDVWLNNPLRPLEACGTSGMKAALNGGLNLSILDGWWDEWFDGENGWAIPTADGVEDPDHRDDLEAAALYDLIESRWRRGSTTATPTACRAAGCRWSGTRWPRSARRCWPSRMVADYVAAAVPARVRGRLGAERPRLRRRQGARGLEASGARGLADRARRPRRVRPASATARRSARCCTCARTSPSATLDAAGRRRSQVVHGRVNEADELTGTQVVALEHVETYEDGRHQFAGDVDAAPHRTVRLHRAGPADAPAVWPTSPRLGLVANA